MNGRPEQRASTQAPPPAPVPGDGRAVHARTRRVHSDELLQGQPTVEICHNGTVYRLQATRLGKLILTK